MRFLLKNCPKGTAYLLDRKCKARTDIFLQSTEIIMFFNKKELPPLGFTFLSEKYAVPFGQEVRKTLIFHHFRLIKRKGISFAKEAVLLPGGNEPLKLNSEG